MTPDDVLLLVAAGIGVLGSLLGAAFGGWASHLASTRAARAHRIQEYRFERLREQRQALDIVMRFNRDVDMMPGTHDVRARDMLEAIRIFDERWSDETRSDMRRIWTEQPREAAKEHFRTVERVMRQIVTETEAELRLPRPADPKALFEKLRSRGD